MRAPTKREIAKATVAEIRAKYPNPLPINDWRAGSYCVLVAATETKGMDICDYVNRFLGGNYDLANEITDLNDAGRFDEAWQALEDALAETGS